MCGGFAFKYQAMAFFGNIEEMKYFSNFAKKKKLRTVITKYVSKCRYMYIIHCIALRIAITMYAYLKLSTGASKIYVCNENLQMQSWVKYEYFVLI